MDNQNFFVTGPVGVGKTYWACEKLVELSAYQLEFDWTDGTKKTRTAYYKHEIISYPEAVLQSKSFKFIESITKTVNEIPFILLDDLWGNERMGFDAVAYFIVDTRIRKGLSTLVTSNMDLGQISAIDDRLASRLSSFRQVVIKGEDRRPIQEELIVIDNSKGGEN